MVGMNILRFKTPLLELPPMTPFTIFLLLLGLIIKANNLKEKRGQTSRIISQLLPPLPLLFPLPPNQV